MIGSLCSRLWAPVPPSKRKWLIALTILIVLAGLVEIGRRIVLSHSLYEVNLREHVPLNYLPPPLAGQRILVFAPHPDDETLGAGGYIKQAVDAGAQVHLVLMTNGEFPELSLVLAEHTLSRRPERFIRLGYIRQQETLAAMRYLGVPESSVTFLGYPNNYLTSMWLPGHWLPNAPVQSVRTRTTYSPYSNSLTSHAIFCGQSVLQDVETVLIREKPDIIITLQPNDIHVDHWPTYTFVRFALGELAARGYGFAERARVYTYLIHRPHWPVPRGYFPDYPLDPPAPLVKIHQTEWLARPLSLAETIDKHKATALYRTQGGSIDPLLLSFARSNELFDSVPVRRWPAGTVVPETPVIIDPAADLDAAALNAHGDILRVALARQDGHMRMVMTLRGKASTAATYHVALHGGDATPANRIFVQYDWTGRKVSGVKLQDGKLVHLAGTEMIVTSAGNTTILTARWPFRNGNARFFLIRAWTTHGGGLVDQTATETYLLAPGM